MTWIPRTLLRFAAVACLLGCHQSSWLHLPNWVPPEDIGTPRDPHYYDLCRSAYFGPTTGQTIGLNPGSVVYSSSQSAPSGPGNFHVTTRTTVRFVGRTSATTYEFARTVEQRTLYDNSATSDRLVIYSADGASSQTIGRITANILPRADGPALYVVFAPPAAESFAC